MNLIDHKSPDTGEISGYGSTFGGPPDSYGDIIERGAFSSTLAEWKARGRAPLLCWMHDITEPAGVWLSLREDAFGLKADGKLTLGTRRGTEAHALLLDKAIDGLSIGFQIRKAIFDEKTGIRYIRDVKLFEISIVSMPANDRARVMEVRRNKSLRELLDDRERILAAPPSDVSLSDLLSTLEQHNTSLIRAATRRR